MVLTWRSQFSPGTSGLGVVPGNRWTFLCAEHFLSLGQLAEATTDSRRVIPFSVGNQFSDTKWESTMLIEEFLKNFFKFIYLFWERQCEQGRGRERERERENPKQALYCQHRARNGVQTHETEIMTWAETKSWLLSLLSHPGAQEFFLIEYVCC